MIHRYTINDYWHEFKVDHDLVMKRSSIVHNWEQSGYSSLAEVDAAYRGVGYVYSAIDTSAQSFIEATQEQMNKLYKQISESSAVLAKPNINTQPVSQKRVCNCDFTELLRYGCTCGGV